MTMTATYSPEDNKLRLYSTERLSKEDYALIKAAGFKWAPKQELFVAPSWTPSREDLLLEFVDEIEDEDISLAERAADRAERFEGYRDNNRTAAHGSAGTFEAGPSVFGHQSQARAERQARRHDRHRTNAVSRWSKAEYWQQRTAGVIHNALYKLNPSVRRSRILKLEAEQRKHEKTRKEYAQRFAAWSKVAAMADNNEPMPKNDDGRAEPITTAQKHAYTLANYGSWSDYQHPRKPDARPTSLYSLLTDAQDPITPAEAAALWLDGKKNPDDQTSYSARWSRHLEMRITYEKAMLGEEGGTAADAEMIPGGFINIKLRWSRIGAQEYQIYKVNKSPATKRVTSVEVWDENRITYKLGECVHSPGLTLVNIERKAENIYRAPTAEELAEFNAKVKEQKAEQKKNAPAAPSLLNLTNEDAEALQQLWNDRARAKHAAAVAAHKTYSDFKPSAVVYMTQDKYSALSKGSYARCETRGIHETGNIQSRFTGLYGCEKEQYKKENGEIVCKIRTTSSGQENYYSPDRVIVITDKPQKGLPIDLKSIGQEQRQEEPAAEEPAAAEIVAAAVEPTGPAELAPAGMLF